MINKQIQTDGPDLLKLIADKKKSTPKSLKSKAQAMWGEMERGSGSTDSEGYDFLGFDPY